MLKFKQWLVRTRYLPFLAIIELSYMRVPVGCSVGALLSAGPSGIRLRLNIELQAIDCGLLSVA